MKKRSKIVIVITCVVFLVIVVALTYLYRLQYRKDIKNVDNLTLATFIDNPCTDVYLSILEEEVDKNAKNLTLKLDNRSERVCEFPKNEIVIDRLIDGEWYYWGTCGNGYEMATSLCAGEQLELKYYLSADVLTDADYIEQYDRKKYTQNGKGGKWIAYPRVQLFSGTYRVHMQGRFLDDNRQDEMLDCEIVCEFEVN